jgi:hypothetical protein
MAPIDALVALEDWPALIEFLPHDKPATGKPATAEMRRR